MTAYYTRSGHNASPAQPNASLTTPNSSSHPTGDSGVSSNGMIGSMSRKGNCWDNAPMESFFGTLKRELIHHERFATKTEAKRRIFEYIEIFYNGWRRHSSIGSVSPIDFERNYQYHEEQVLINAC